MSSSLVNISIFFCLNEKFLTFTAAVTLRSCLSYTPTNTRLSQYSMFRVSTDRIQSQYSSWLLRGKSFSLTTMFQWGWLDLNLAICDKFSSRRTHSSSHGNIHRKNKPKSFSSRRERRREDVFQSFHSLFDFFLSVHALRSSNEHFSTSNDDDEYVML